MTNTPPTVDPLPTVHDAQPASAADLRDAMVAALLTAGHITTPEVERAFRTVPREKFVPAGTTLEAAYDSANAVPVKQLDNGVVISSTSAPFIQARMLEQARLRAGMRVLEIGSGGCNAALCAEIVGTGGHVTSVDIDREVTDHARAALEATGYGERVTVVHADADAPIPGLHGPVDVVLVTVGAWDLAPAWLEQLSLSGRIVVPLRMNGVTRSIAFTRQGDHLTSTSAEVCGFVAMQGAGAHDETILGLPDVRGNQVKLRFDDAAPQDVHALDGVLATERGQLWSDITIGRGVSFADLHLWFAAFLPGFCKLEVDPDIELATGRERWFPFGVVRADSFAYLVTRPTLDDDGGVELGARAYGATGPVAAAAMVEQIQAWHHAARERLKPTFTYWPTGTPVPAAQPGVAVLAKTHGHVTIAWLTAPSESQETLHGTTTEE